MAEHSANLAPRTAAQTSWYALRHSEEAKEILFNKALFVKGKSVSSYIIHLLNVSLFYISLKSNIVQIEYV